MARVQADLLGHYPSVKMIDAEHALLSLFTTAGTIEITLLPFQGRELASILASSLGDGETRDDVIASLTKP